MGARTSVLAFSGERSAVLTPMKGLACESFSITGLRCSEGPWARGDPEPPTNRTRTVVLVSMVQRIEFSSSRDTSTICQLADADQRPSCAGDPWERRDFTRETETAWKGRVQ